MHNVWAIYNIMHERVKLSIENKFKENNDPANNYVLNNETLRKGVNYV